MFRLRCLASFALVVCCTAGAWAQEPEEPKVDAFQHFFGRSEEESEAETEAPAEAPPTDPEAKRDAFRYLFGRRTQAAVSEEQPAKKPVAKKQPEGKVQTETLAPAPVEALKAQPVEPKPEAISPSPQEKPEEKLKVDAFQYFFGQKEKDGEKGSSEPKESEPPPI